MDTRRKLVSLEGLASLLSTGEWIVVAGLFDPLTAVQARRLRELAQDGRKLAAVVLKNPNTLLDADARAVLVASLRDVDAVSIAEPEEWRNMTPEGNLRIIEDLSGEQERSAEFVRFVIARERS